MTCTLISIVIIGAIVAGVIDGCLRRALILHQICPRCRYRTNPQRREDGAAYDSGCCANCGEALSITNTDRIRDGQRPVAPRISGFFKPKKTSKQAPRNVRIIDDNEWA